MTLTLGPDWERNLWASPHRLRFGLNEGGAYLTMFTTSYDRARCLARAALPTDGLIGVIAAYPDPRTDIRAEQHGWMGGTGFDYLEELGVPTKAALATWKGYCWPGDDEDDEAELWVHRAVNLTWDQADILIWNQVAQDIGIGPVAPVKSKLVNLAHGVSVDAYDDRGMDITSITKEQTAGLYDQFRSWLLDYDRPLMKEIFEG
ncbi:DUF3885 domain-containing protein [Altererythrobacter salegens]|uniref:DUF3885 domain-containing protein n=1 Tax=Croceibacterium salegens TaxID=1737568 RepID=A0A6I4SVJ2_9SPHN|nr:DUF3885 domain-containing protein [Croceibacterium salegens]MXO60124.1 DUF3885 domain-containing protein [Croceibacterium salegens]